MEERSLMSSYRQDGSEHQNMAPSGYAYHPPAMSGQPQYSGPMYNQSNAAYDKPMFSPNGPGYQGMNADYGSYNNQAMLNMKRSYEPPGQNMQMINYNSPGFSYNPVSDGVSSGQVNDYSQGYGSAPGSQNSSAPWGVYNELNSGNYPAMADSAMYGGANPYTDNPNMPRYPQDTGMSYNMYGGQMVNNDTNAYYNSSNTNMGGNGQQMLDTNTQVPNTGMSYNANSSNNFYTQNTQPGTVGYENSSYNANQQTGSGVAVSSGLNVDGSGKMQQGYINNAAKQETCSENKLNTLVGSPDNSANEQTVSEIKSNDSLGIVDSQKSDVVTVDTSLNADKTDVSGSNNGSDTETNSENVIERANTDQSAANENSAKNVSEVEVAKNSTSSVRSDGSNTDENNISNTVDNEENTDENHEKEITRVDKDASLNNVNESATLACVETHKEGSKTDKNVVEKEPNLSKDISTCRETVDENEAKNNAPDAKGSITGDNESDTEACNEVKTAENSCKKNGTGISLSGVIAVSSDSGDGISKGSNGQFDSSGSSLGHQNKDVGEKLPVGTEFERNKHPGNTSTGDEFPVDNDDIEQSKDAKNPVGETDTVGTDVKAEKDFTLENNINPVSDVDEKQVQESTSDVIIQQEEKPKVTENTDVEKSDNTEYKPTEKEEISEKSIELSDPENQPKNEGLEVKESTADKTDTNSSETSHSKRGKSSSKDDIWADIYKIEEDIDEEEYGDDSTEDDDKILDEDIDDESIKAEQALENMDEDEDSNSNEGTSSDFTSIKMKSEEEGEKMDGESADSCESEADSQCQRREVHFTEESVESEETKPYTCGECGKSWKCKSHLEVHMRSHTLDRPFNCEVCDKSFSTHSSLVRHHKVHSIEKNILSCQAVDCGEKYLTSEELKSHISTSHDSDELRCTECGKWCHRKFHLNEHMRVHSQEKPFACAYCPTKFTTNCSMSRHMKKRHENELQQETTIDSQLPSTSPTPVTSTLPPKASPSTPKTSPSPAKISPPTTTSLSPNHSSKLIKLQQPDIPSIKDIYPSPDDDNSNSSGVEEDVNSKPMETEPSAISKTLNTTPATIVKTENIPLATKTNTIIASILAMPTVAKTSLNATATVTLDTETSTHSCKSCGKDFKERSELTEHVKTQHNQFRCSDCGKVCQRRSHLIEHQRSHTLEKPFSCPGCSKAFTTHSSLLRHLRLHSVCSKLKIAKEKRPLNSQLMNAIIKKTNQNVLHTKAQLKVMRQDADKRVQTEDPSAASAPKIEVRSMDIMSLKMGIARKLSMVGNSGGLAAKAVLNRANKRNVDGTFKSGASESRASERKEELDSRYASNYSGFTRQVSAEEFQISINSDSDEQEVNRSFGYNKRTGYELNQSSYSETGSSLKQIDAIEESFGDNDKRTGYELNESGYSETGSTLKQIDAVEESFELRDDNGVAYITIQPEDCDSQSDYTEHDLNSFEISDSQMEEKELEVSKNSSICKDSGSSYSKPGRRTLSKVSSMSQLGRYVKTDEKVSYDSDTSEKGDNTEQKTIQNTSVKMHLKKDSTPKGGKDSIMDNKTSILKEIIQKESFQIESNETDDSSANESSSEKTIGKDQTVSKKYISNTLPKNETGNTLSKAETGNTLSKTDVLDVVNSLAETGIFEVFNSFSDFTQEDMVEVVNSKIAEGGTLEISHDSISKLEKEDLMKIDNSAALLGVDGEAGSEGSASLSLREIVDRIKRDASQFQCRECDHCFEDNNQLENHIKTVHTSAYICQECGKVCSRKFFLIEHMRTHSNEKPFVCKYCDKNFSTHSSVIRHLKTACKKGSYKESDDSGPSQTSLEEVRRHILNVEKSITTTPAPATASTPKTPTKPQTQEEVRALATSPVTQRALKIVQIFKNQSAAAEREAKQTLEKITTASENKVQVTTTSILNKLQSSHSPRSRLHSPISSRSHPIQPSLSPRGHPNQPTLSPRGHPTQPSLSPRSHPTLPLAPESIRSVPTTMVKKWSLQDKPYACVECDKSFAIHSSLTKHVRAFHGDMPFKCPECGKSCLSKCHLEGHMRTHTSEKPYSCRKCGKKFITNSSLLRHLKISCKSSPTSSTSTRESTSDTCKQEVQRHILNVQQTLALSGPGPTKHPSIYLSPARKPEMSIDTKQEAAEIVSKILGRSVEEIRSSAGERSYKSEFDGERSFVAEMDIDFTQNRDNPEKPYTCRECNKSFAVPASLKNHVRSFHGDTPHKCHECGRCCLNRTHLLEHMRSHTFEKPFHCKTCGKWFTTYSSLVRHNRTGACKAPIIIQPLDGDEEGDEPENDLERADLDEALDLSLEIDIHDTSDPDYRPSSKSPGQVGDNSRLLQAPGSVKKECELCHKSFATHSSLRRHIRNRACKKQNIVKSRGLVNILPKPQVVDNREIRNVIPQHTGNNSDSDRPDTAASTSNTHSILLPLLKRQQQDDQAENYDSGKRVKTEISVSGLSEYLEERSGVFSDDSYASDSNSVLNMSMDGGGSFLTNPQGKKVAVEVTCPECGISFPSKSQMKVHKKMHAMPKPYTCDKCDKCFAIEVSLKKHVRAFHGSQPFKCEECGRICLNKHHLLSHMQTHIGNKQYMCDICKVKFTTRGNMTRHVREAHSDDARQYYGAIE